MRRHLDAGRASECLDGSLRGLLNVENWAGREIHSGFEFLSFSFLPRYDVFVRRCPAEAITASAVPIIHDQHWQKSFPIQYRLGLKLSIDSGLTQVTVPAAIAAGDSRVPKPDLCSCEKAAISCQLTVQFGLRFGSVRDDYALIRVIEQQDSERSTRLLASLQHSTISHQTNDVLTPPFSLPLMFSYHRHFHMFIQ